ncbi:MAG: type ii secretion system protein e [Chthonomonadaceae bacterium]|nr:type ii secretion system protein e [Chthonomonadaceae bacterium]
MVTMDVKHYKLPMGERLVAQGLINERQLAQALEYQQETRMFLGQALVSLGFLTMATVGPTLEETSGFPYVDLSSTDIDMDAARLLPEALAREKKVLLFAATDTVACVAMIDPLNLTLVDDLRGRLNRRIEPYVVFETDLLDAIGRVYDIRMRTQKVLDEIAEAPIVDPELSIDTLIGLAEDAPIVRLVNSLIQSAVSGGASDLHIEPQEKGVRIRFRQDGVLYEQATIPRQHLPAVASRIKIMASMNIAERRRPQDGRINFRSANGLQYDLRVSSLPLIYGEKIVMRVLAKNSSFANSATLGFFPPQKALFETFIRQAHGLMLVTGPTGSGKSTTLFAALNQINDSTRNINTVEDPVEYNVPGVNQMQVNAQIGVTFAAGLRTLLRQDPDVVMVGEIRDKETAEMAVQAALTGHLVLSTLHTNSAAGALTRLLNMGIEPFLITSSLIGTIGQRLLRTICPHCKEPGPVDHAKLAMLGCSDPNKIPQTLPVGRGCEKCGGRGMKGRTAVYELMPMTDVIREMVMRNAPTESIHHQAVSAGMLTMRNAGLEKVLMGQTTPDELLRVLFSEGA